MWINFSKFVKIKKRKNMAKATKEVKVNSKYQEALDKLNKTYGVGTVLTLDSKGTGDYDLISTGSIGFDNITLGVGDRKSVV